MEPEHGHELGLLGYILVAGWKPRLVHDDRVPSRCSSDRSITPTTLMAHWSVAILYARAAHASRNCRFITLPLALRGSGSDVRSIVSGTL